MNPGPFRGWKEHERCCSSVMIGRRTITMWSLVGDDGRRLATRRFLGKVCQEDGFDLYLADAAKQRLLPVVCGWLMLRALDFNASMIGAFCVDTA
jgi:hypothetical protein